MASNRFFLNDGSSSSEESSDDEQQVQVQTTKKSTGKGGAKSAPKPYLAVSDDEEDVKRVVRSEKEKRYEEIEEIIKKTKHAMRIRDIGLVFECYENLIKAFEKARRVLEKDQGLPRPFIKILAQLDDFVTKCWSDREWREALTKNNSNNLSALRQKNSSIFKTRTIGKRNQCLS
jgi:translation initiation factor 3 subunit C